MLMHTATPFWHGTQPVSLHDSQHLLCLEVANKSLAFGRFFLGLPRLHLGVPAICVQGWFNRPLGQVSEKTCKPQGCAYIAM